MNLAFEVFLSFQMILLLAAKSHDTRLTALLPLRRKASRGLIFIASAGFKPANVGFSGKNANHYTTEAT
jgi:hypothetical protein